VWCGLLGDRGPPPVASVIPRSAAEKNLDPLHRILRMAGRVPPALARRGRLPERVQRCVREQAERLGRTEALTAPPQPFIVRREDTRLSIRLIPDSPDDLLVLEEEQTKVDYPALEQLGLTPREAEVLHWVRERFEKTRRVARPGLQALSGAIFISQDLGLPVDHLSRGWCRIRGLGEWPARREHWGTAPRGDPWRRHQRCAHRRGRSVSMPQ
jgi:hypothetical protein